MNIFKNEVGRPSNETLKKRRLIIGGGIAFAILLVFSAVMLIGNNSGSNLTTSIRDPYFPTKATINFIGQYAYVKITTRGGMTYTCGRISDKGCNKYSITLYRKRLFKYSVVEKTYTPKFLDSIYAKVCYNGTCLTTNKKTKLV